MIKYLGTVGSTYYFQITLNGQTGYFSAVNQSDATIGLRFVMTPVQALPSGLTYQDSWRIVANTATTLTASYMGKFYRSNITIAPTTSGGGILLTAPPASEITEAQAQQDIAAMTATLGSEGGLGKTVVIALLLAGAAVFLMGRGR